MQTGETITYYKWHAVLRQLFRIGQAKNKHLTDKYLMKLASHPKVVSIVSDLIGSDDINIFGTRIRCKLPEMAWHQDSRYYNMTNYNMISLWLGEQTIFKYFSNPSVTFNISNRRLWRHENCHENGELHWLSRQQRTKSRALLKEARWWLAHWLVSISDLYFIRPS